MTDTRDLDWLGGLIEGEGCFSSFKSRPTSTPCPTVVLTTTDLDVAQRAAGILGARVNTKIWKARPEHYKQGYDVRVSGNRAAGWMFTLWPLLGKRRRARIAEVIGVWRHGKTPRPKRNATCHPNRPHVAKDLCGACYQRANLEAKRCRAA